MPPLDIPNIGRFAVITDPQGATLAIMTSANQDWAESKPKNAEFCWDEFIVQDPKAAAAFYSTLFPWQSEPTDMGPMGTYYVMKNGDKPTAGGMAPPDAGAAAAWLAYVAVDDVDASTKRAEKLGATVFAPPTEIPGMLRFSIFSDPTGAVLGLFKDLKS